jgi:hypothetical protein
MDAVIMAMWPDNMVVPRRRNVYKVSIRSMSAVMSVIAMVIVVATIIPQAVQAQGLRGYRIQHTREWHDQQNQARLAGAGNMNYYGGQVMITSKTYSIFWIPAGYTVASGYQSLINRYLADIGGSAFYNIMTQYYQNPGTQHIQNVSTFGATIIDTQAYPGGRGTPANPLTDADIQAEVQRAATANGWAPSVTNMFLVFTAKGVESCIDSATCTPGTAHPAFCAYHGYFTAGSQNYVYANMPYDETWTTSCRSFTKSPNSNIAADSEISTLSHEHFEAVTDVNPPPTTPNPGVTAWTDSAGYEIGDKCAYSYGTKASNGSNITLNGHPYIMQLEWSNSKRACAKN